MVMTMAPAAFAADGGAQFQNCLLYTSVFGIANDKSIFRQVDFRSVLS